MKAWAAAWGHADRVVMARVVPTVPLKAAKARAWPMAVVARVVVKVIAKVARVMAQVVAMAMVAVVKIMTRAAVMAMAKVMIRADKATAEARDRVMVAVARVKAMARADRDMDAMVRIVVKADKAMATVVVARTMDRVARAMAVDAARGKARVRDNISNTATVMAAVAVWIRDKAMV